MKFKVAVEEVSLELEDSTLQTITETFVLLIPVK